MATTIYEIQLDEVEDYYKDDIFVSYLMNDSGFNAFDISNQYPGSIVDGDTLYLLITDYNPVDVNGIEVELSDELLMDFSIEELRDAGFIEPADDSIIKRYLSKYELAPFDFDDVATDLVQTEGYMFVEVLKAADDLDLLDDIVS